ARAPAAPRGDGARPRPLAARGWDRARARALARDRLRGLQPHEALPPALLRGGDAGRGGRPGRGRRPSRRRRHAARARAGRAGVRPGPVAGSRQLVAQRVSAAERSGALRGDWTRSLDRYLRAHRGGTRYAFGSISPGKAAALLAVDPQPVLLLTSYHSQPLVS